MHTMNLHTQVAMLIDAGIAENTRKANAQDKRYFERWCQLRFGLNQPYPVSIETLFQYILDHNQGMPKKIETQLVVEKLKRKIGPWAISTLKRNLSTLATVHQKMGMTDPTKDNQVKLLIRRLSHQTPKRTRKKAITLATLQAMIATCTSNKLIDVRDKALLLVGFASGGRRRSELVDMLYEDLQKIDHGYLVTIRKSKTDQLGKGRQVPILDEAATALNAWILQSGIREGRLFRSVNRWQQLGSGLSARSVHDIVTNRLKLAGFDHTQYCAHSLRSGFISEAARQGIPLPDSMTLSGHSTLTTALSYYRSGQVQDMASARLTAPHQ